MNMGIFYTFLRGYAWWGLQPWMCQCACMLRKHITVATDFVCDLLVDSAIARMLKQV